MSTENEVKDLNAMTPEQQRIAIAEACGWKNVRREWVGCGSGDAKDFLGDKANCGRRWSVPDYLNSLDAMHEAFGEIRKRGLVQEYGNELIAVTTVDRGAYFAHATAAQRAEAFLKTLGKWKDS